MEVLNITESFPDVFGVGADEAFLGSEGRRTELTRAILRGRLARVVSG